jgi:DNA-binding GntR family transcriptional regulator
MMRKRKPPTSLADQATDTIRDRILDMTLAPGMQLDESILRERLSISRTPAREALNRLVAEGLVESRSNKGFYVTLLDVRQTARFFDAFFIVERAAGALCNFSHPNFVADLKAIQAKHDAAVANDSFLAISQHNAEFHVRITRATENDYLVDFAKRVHNYARRLVYFVYATESDDYDYFSEQQGKIIEEHLIIISAIQQQDRLGLIEILSRHAQRFQTRMLRFIGGRWLAANGVETIVRPKVELNEGSATKTSDTALARSRLTQKTKEKRSRLT